MLMVRDRKNQARRFMRVGENDMVFAPVRLPSELVHEHARNPTPRIQGQVFCPHICLLFSCASVISLDGGHHQFTVKNRSLHFRSV
jgi:hypothetical protein